LTDTKVNKEYIPKRKRNRWIVDPFKTVGAAIEVIAGWAERQLKGGGKRWKRAVKSHRAAKRPTENANVTRIMALAVTIVMETKSVKYKNPARFDTDSIAIGIDNRCTACISDRREHFIGDLKPGKKMIKGFHGEKETSVMSGTIRWRWLDGNGSQHQFDIPNSYYIPDGECCLLSPQHWAQTQLKESGLRAWEITDGEGCTLCWDGGTSALHVPLGERDNVATFMLAQVMKSSPCSKQKQI
jgi:hypothetical protein